MSVAPEFEERHLLLAALDSARSALSEAGACREWSLSDFEVVEALEVVLATRAQVDALAAALVGQADTRCLALSLDSATTGRWLRRRYRVSAREADRLTELAAALPRHEQVQSAMAAGEVSSEQAEAMTRALESLPASVGACDRERAEELLVEQAATLEPAELATCGRTLVEVLITSPDVDDPAEAKRLAQAAEAAAVRQEDLQALSLRTRGDGMIRVGGLLAPLAGAAVRAALAGLARPLPGPDGRRDLRRPEQRMAAALHELACLAQPQWRGADPAPPPRPPARDPGRACPAALGAWESEGEASAENEADRAGANDAGLSTDEPDSGALDGVGGEGAGAPLAAVGEAGRQGQVESREPEALPRAAPAQVSLIVRWETLESMRPRAGQLEDGTSLSPSQLLTALCDAAVLPMVFAGPGKPLSAGRRRRLFSRTQRAALAARDRGCSYPGCTRPVSATTAHHLVHWAQGGGTDVDNGALLCLYHHTLVHRERWQGRIASNGYPEFVPPPEYDPDRKPRQHLRYRPSR